MKIVVIAAFFILFFSCQTIDENINGSLCCPDIDQRIYPEKSGIDEQPFFISDRINPVPSSDKIFRELPQPGIITKPIMKVTERQENLEIFLEANQEKLKTDAVQEVQKNGPPILEEQELSDSDSSENYIYNEFANNMSEEYYLKTRQRYIDYYSQSPTIKEYKQPESTQSTNNSYRPNQIITEPAQNLDIGIDDIQKKIDIETSGTKQYNIDREQYTHVQNLNWLAGEKTIIELPGGSWYLETPANISVPKQIDRSFANGITSFTFLPETDGEYTLVFSRQDNFQGIIEKQKITISVVSKIHTAVPLKQNNEYIDSVEIPNSIETIQETNIKSETPADESAYIPEEIAYKSLFDPSGLEGLDKNAVMRIAENYASLGNIAYSINVCECAINDLFPYDFNDDFLWVLAGLYEKESPDQDYHLAVLYYRKLCDLYPLSQYYQKSFDRAGYLERYYIDFK